MKKILTIIFLLLLTACGGGGGGGGAAPVSSSGGGGGGSSGGGGGGGGGTPTPTWDSSVSSEEADVYRTGEYDNQWGLEAIHAAEAYAVLNKNGKAVGGDDVRVGITDTGANITHQEIAGNINNSLNRNFNVYPFTSNVNDTNGHGTHTMSTVAGVKDGLGMHGVAFNAETFSVAMIGFSYENGIQYSANNGAKVVNMSWGYNFYSAYNGDVAPNLDTNGAASYYGDYLEMLVAKSKDTLMVVATGNDGDQRGNGQFPGQNPNYLTYQKPGIPALFANNTELAGYVLAVGAVEQYGSNFRISDFSNSCSVAKEYCLTAPGYSIYAAWIGSNGAYAYDTGTSMAAPHVTGAAAVLRGAWPFLTAPQTAQILLQTATDMGAPGVDDVYGHGMLNLYAAVQAYGQNTITFGTSVGDGGYDARASSMMTSPIFGDAFTNNVAPQLSKAVFFDDFGRDYKANLSRRIDSYKPTHQTDLAYLMNSNINSRTLPINFGENGKSHLNFNLSNFKNSDAQNVMGLKHLVMDKSIDPQLMNTQNTGFSFVQQDAILPNSKFGFSFNYDEISAGMQKDFGTSGFILKNNFAANPFQDYMRQGTQNFWYNSRKFNQVFADHSFFDNKFALKFSYQNSYESPQLGVKGEKQNEMIDMGMSFKTKNDLNLLVSTGSLTEFKNNMLNARSVGAFEADGNVKTSYVKLTAAKKFMDHFQLIASISEGYTKINGNQIGIFRNFEDIRSRSTSLALVHNNFMNGEIGLSYQEPMRVYRGSVSYNIPVARDFSGNVMRYSGSASLAPNGREQDFEIFYNRGLKNSASLRMNFLMQKEMANIKNFPTNYLGFVTYAKKF